MRQFVNLEMRLEEGEDKGESAKAILPTSPFIFQLSITKSSI
jgi:hypothetical protein